MEDNIKKVITKAKAETLGELTVAFRKFNENPEKREELYKKISDLKRKFDQVEELEKDYEKKEESSVKKR